MKYSIILFLVAIIVTRAVENNLQKAAPVTKVVDSVRAKLVVVPLRIVFGQDCSGSIKANGVELITSAIFDPYYEDIDRYIEIHFLCITDSSARKPISLTLRPPSFKRPEQIDAKNTPITEQRIVQNKYNIAINQFEKDSILYFSRRQNEINGFRKTIDSLLEIYKSRPSSTTDILPAFSIADRIFNFSIKDGARNVFIVNTDGIDSRQRFVAHLRNKALIIVTNANGIEHTNLDSLSYTVLATPEAAIQYSLKK